jgi:hypothetical protein
MGWILWVENTGKQRALAAPSRDSFPCWGEFWVLQDILTYDIEGPDKSESTPKRYCWPLLLDWQNFSPFVLVPSRNDNGELDDWMKENTQRSQWSRFLASMRHKHGAREWNRKRMIMIPPHNLPSSTRVDYYYASDERFVFLWRKRRKENNSFDTLTGLQRWVNKTWQSICVLGIL